MEMLYRRQWMQWKGCFLNLDGIDEQLEGHKQLDHFTSPWVALFALVNSLIVALSTLRLGFPNLILSNGVVFTLYAQKSELLGKCLYLSLLTTKRALIIYFIYFGFV